MKLHKSLTEKRVTNAVKEGMFGIANPGFCLTCGEDAEGCEPDARKYLCESCGEHTVYGAEEVLYMI